MPIRRIAMMFVVIFFCFIAIYVLSILGLKFDTFTVSTTIAFVIMGFLAAGINIVYEASKGWNMPWLIDSINKFTLMQCCTVAVTILFFAWLKKSPLLADNITVIFMMLTFLVVLFGLQVVVYHRQRDLTWAFAQKVVNGFLCGQNCIMDQNAQRRLIQELIEVDFTPNSITNRMEGEKKGEKRELFCLLLKIATNPAANQPANPIPAATSSTLLEPSDFLLPDNVQHASQFQERIAGLDKDIRMKHFYTSLYRLTAIFSFVVFITAMLFLARFQVTMGRQP